VRYISAAIAFVAGLVLCIVGGVQIATANSADRLSLEGQTTSSAPLLVIPSDTLTAHAGPQTIQVTGGGHLTAVVGREADVTAWVGDVAHSTATIDAEGKALTVSEPVGATAQAPALKGGDLWYAEYEGEGSVAIDTALPPNFAVVVAADGKAPAATSVSIMWPLDERAPWAGPLIVAGILLVVVAAALLTWALLARRNRPSARRARAAKRDELPIGAPAAPIAAGAAGAVALAPVDHQGANGPLEPAAAAGEVRAEGTTGASADEVAETVPGFVGSPFVAAAAESPDSPQPPTAEDVRWAPSSAQPPVQGADDNAIPGFVSSPFSSAAADAAAEPASAEPAVVGTPASAEPAPVAAASERPRRHGRRASAAPVDGGENEQAGGPSAAAGDESVPAVAPGAAPEAAPAEERRDDDGPDSGAGSGEPPASGGSGSGSAPSDESTPSETDRWKRPRGRDRANAPKRMLRFAPVLLVGALTLSGCSANYWPEAIGGAGPAPTPSATSVVDEALTQEGAPLPAVTEEQLGRILAAAANVAKQADAAKNASLLDSRFTGSARAERDAKYRAAAVDANLPAPDAFPTGSVVYAIPQATEAWPRTVFAVVEPGTGEGAPYGVMLEQADARSQYKASSLVRLEANAALPQAAPVAIGAPGLDQLPKSLVIAPDQLAAAYGDIITNGDQSQYAAQFDPATDTLRNAIGQAYRDQQNAAIDQKSASIAFSNRPADVAPEGVTALDGGAIVAVSMEELETLKAKTQLATITITGATAALAGTGTSNLGFEKIYTDQLLFYVPTAESGGKIQLLGFSQALTSARPLQASEVTFG